MRTVLKCNIGGAVTTADLQTSCTLPMLSVVCDLGNKHDRVGVTCQESLGVWDTVPSSGPATADHVAL